MPLKLNINVNKKLGLPDYSSIGAGCGLELELDQSLLVSDPAGLQARVQQAYAACRQAVEDELARHHETAAALPEVATPVRGATTTAPPAPPRNGNGHQASTKQLDYVRQLAGQIDGLGVRKLDALAQRMFGKPVAGLTTLDASGLIDCLKSIKAGEIKLDDVLNSIAT